MAFLTFNGITCPIQRDSYKESEPKLIGSSDRAADGSLVESVLRYKRSAKFELIPMSKADAWAWENFFLGEGHHISLDSNLYSSKGLGPTVYANVATSAGTRKHGAASGAIQATAQVLKYEDWYSTEFTLIHWHFNGATWDHWVRRNDGVTQYYYKAGAYDGTGDTWVTTSAGDVSFTSGGSAMYVDDLVLLPFCVPASWVPSIYTWHSSNAWTDIPWLHMGGDAVPETAGRLVRAMVSGRDVKGRGLYQLSVSLTEV